MLSLTYVGKMIILIWQTSADRLWISEYPVVRNKIFTSLEKKKRKKKRNQKPGIIDLQKLSVTRKFVICNSLVFYFIRAKGGCNNC